MITKWLLVRPAILLGVVAFVLLSPAEAAESDDYEQALIDHVVAIEGVRALKSDRQCGYTVKTDKLPRAPYRELTIRLSATARIEFEREFSSPAMQAKLAGLGRTGKDIVAKLAGEFDERTSCGMWAGYAFSELKRTERALAGHLGRVPR